MQPDEVLEFWFGPEGTAPLARAEKWFKKDPAFDEEIRAKFEPSLLAATRGELEEWKHTARGRLAFIVLLDQFSRNLYRDSPKSFAQDRLALAVSLEGQALGMEKSLPHVQRVFFYIPMLHTEDLELQRRALAAYQDVASTAPPELEKYLASSIDFARKHMAVIERFGRFPHRNRILGRHSTPEELDYLAQPGAGF